MTRHQKRLSVPKSWPVERKTDKYTVKAGAGPHGEDGVPLLILLRDVLGYVDSRKEARVAVGADAVRINGVPVRDVSRPVGMFDILAFEDREEYYRVFPDEGGRLSLTPIPAEAADGKLGKIVDKRHVPGGAVQLSLHDGATIQVEDGAAYAAGDSIVIGFEDGEILAHFGFEPGALVTAVRGQHAGRIGEVDEIDVVQSSAPNNVTVNDLDTDAQFETIEAYVVVIDENFIDGGADA